MQQGGASRIIPKYIDSRNNPFKTNENKQIDTSRYNEIKRVDVQNEPLVEFKFNESIYKNNKPANQSMVPSAYVPIQNHYLPNNFPYVNGTGGMPYSYVPNNVPIIKNYNLSLPNPAGDHVKIADLFEDMLPNTGKYNNTSITLDERLIIYNYVRAVLVNIGDGEDIDINGRIKEKTDRKNLLSYLKLLDLNPYHNSKLSHNPYVSLPDKMIMYRSCYPVRFDAAKNKIACSKYSIGLNLRIYDMSKVEYEVKRTPGFKHAEFNLWREIAFYEYIKEEILKKKICPHFPLLYSYFISSATAIDFKKLRGIKNKFGQELSKANQNNLESITKKYKEEMEQQLLVPLSIDKQPIVGLPVSDKKKSSNLGTIDLDYKGNNNFKVKDINTSIDRCVLALTEAPNYNILQWATKTYENVALGPVKKMIQTGYHSEEVWYSVIFQMLIALHVMHLKKITIIDMSLQDNIYIKDLMNNEQTLGYWKYIFNGFEFYIPNHGFLLLIDSTFKDIKNSHATFLTKPENEINQEAYKTYGKVDGNFKESNDDGSPTEDMKKLDEFQYENLQKLFSDNFNNTFTNEGGIKPPREIIELIGLIRRSIEVKKIHNGDLSDIIINYMRRFVHNRVGTPLSETENKIVNSQIVETNLKKGNLYPFKIRDEVHVWVMFIEDNHDDDNTIKVLSRSEYKDSDEIMECNVPKAQIYQYKSLHPIEQKYKANETKLGEEELLETYRIY